MRPVLLIPIAAAIAAITFGCGNGSQPATTASTAAKPPHVKITQFYASDRRVPRGLKGNLCYGVEHAAKVELKPAVETLWPSAARCFEVTPKTKTTYELTAIGEDGSKETKSLEISVGAPPPRLYDLWVNSVDVSKGAAVKVCFKLENAKSVKVSPGKLDGTGKCLNDHPSQTTTYKITALGGDEEIDTGTVTVKVH